MVGHIKVLAVFHILWGAMWVLAALFAGIVSLFAFGVLAVAGDVGAEGVLIFIFVFLVLVFAFGLLAIPSLVGGIALLKRQRWARVPLIVSGVLAVTNFPHGLVLGAYTLIVLLDEDVRRELDKW